MLNNIVFIILSLSISGSFISLLLLAGKPIFKKHLSKAFSYYVWILVLLRLVLPFSIDQSVMNLLFDSVSSYTQMSAQPKKTAENVSEDNISHQSIKESGQDMAAAKNNENSPVQYILTIIWLTGVGIQLLCYVIPYIYFKLKIKVTNVDPDSKDAAVFHSLYGVKKIKLRYNSSICTPMLIGILSPCIVIPGCNYVKNGMKEELENILCHELMHYKRKDLIYKWFTIVITSLHWFNPLMISIRRQITRSCELSCDEAVISKMNALQKQSYGETLLSMAAGKRLSAGLLATTLCEEKKELKIRLLSIMKYKKQTSGMLLLSVIIVIFLTGCSTILGSVSNEDTASISTQEDTSGNETADMNNDEKIDLAGDGPDAGSETQNDSTNAGNSTAPDDSTNIPDNTESNNIITENPEDKTEEYLRSPEGKRLKETTDSFVKAFFSSDKEEIEKYLEDDVEFDPYVYEDNNGNEMNVYDKLIHLLAKWYGASDETAEVQYEYQLEGEDSYTYLGIVLKYSADKWVVTNYYTEK